MHHQSIATTLASSELWVVGVVVAASVVSERLLLPAILVAIIFRIACRVRSGKPGQTTPLDGPILVLVLMLPITMHVTTMPDVTYPQVYRVVTGVMLYYAIVNWTTTPGRVRVLVYGLILAGLVLAAGALVSVEWDRTKVSFIPQTLYRRLAPIVSDTVNPNVMAGQLVLLVPFPLALLLWTWRQSNWLVRGVSIITVLACSGVFVLTQSRGGTIALLGMLSTMLLLRWKQAWIALAGLAVVAVVVFQSAWGQDVWTTLTTSEQAIRSQQERVELWSRAVELIERSPVTGVGMGTFEKVVDDVHPFEIVYTGLGFHQTGRGAHAHNLFLQVAVDLGLPGLLAWCAMLALVVRAAWRVARHGAQMRDGWIRGVGIGLVCSHVALITHGMIDAVTWGMVRPAVLVWGVWGVAIAAEARVDTNV